MFTGVVIFEYKSADSADRFPLVYTTPAFSEYNAARNSAHVMASAKLLQGVDRLREMGAASSVKSVCEAADRIGRYTSAEYAYSIPGYPDAEYLVRIAVSDSEASEQ